ncbi:hypothetical protein SprV_0100320000 [Sparganum proliferum]
MMARVTDNGAVSEAFTVTNGVKQDCVLAPTLFSLMFSPMLMDAYRDERPGIRITYKTDGHLLNRRRIHFQSRINCTSPTAPTVVPPFTPSRSLRRQIILTALPNPPLPSSPSSSSSSSSFFFFFFFFFFSSSSSFSPILSLFLPSSSSFSFSSPSPLSSFATTTAAFVAPATHISTTRNPDTPTNTYTSTSVPKGEDQD